MAIYGPHPIRTMNRAIAACEAMATIDAKVEDRPAWTEAVARLRALRTSMEEDDDLNARLRAAGM